MRYKVGDKVKVITKPFEEVFGEKNEWVIDFIKTQAKKKPSLYVCYNKHNPHKELYQFTEEEEVEKV